MTDVVKIERAGTTPRNIWERVGAEALYNLPFTDLMFQAQGVHRANFDPNRVETAIAMRICWIASASTPASPDRNLRRAGNANLRAIDSFLASET